MTTASRARTDPFQLAPLGSRPSLAAYWPDTTFIELNPAAAYLDMLGQKALELDDSTALDAKLAVALSVIQHENIHRWIAHVRSWGILRRLIDIIQLDLMGVFLHSLQPDILTRALKDDCSGRPLLNRASNFDVVIDPAWPGTTHSAAEHAWICTILRSVIDHGHHRLAELRPPEYMYGVLAQYLSAGADVVAVLQEDNAAFQRRVRSFKAWQRPTKLFLHETHSGDDLFRVINTSLPSAAAIEECQAVIAQYLYYSGAGDWSGRAGAPIVEAFNQELWQSIAEPHGALYSAGFAHFAMVTGCSFDLSVDPRSSSAATLSVICDLALNPPLGFDREGNPAASGWHEVHPSLRFGALCRACTKIPRSKWPDHDDIGAVDYRHFCDSLLDLSSLQTAAPDDLIQLIRLTRDTYESRGYYPLKGSLRIFHDAAVSGFDLVNRHPRLLVDPWGEMAAMGGEPAAPDSFFDPPLLIIDGRPHGDGLSDRDYFTHVYGWTIARVVRAMTIDRGAVSFAGLPGDGIDSGSLREGARAWCAETFLGSKRP